MKQYGPGLFPISCESPSGLLSIRDGWPELFQLHSYRCTCMYVRNLHYDSHPLHLLHVAMPSMSCVRACCQLHA